MVREPLELPIVITVEDDGDKRHIEYAGDRLLSIGRAPDCSIVLEASRASRRHAEIVGEGGHYTLIDAGSANGTHLNGRRIEREGLRAGDVIQIGGATLTFGARARAPAAPPAAAPAVPAAPVAPAREGAPRRADPASAPGTGPAPAPGGTPASARRGRPSPFIRAVNIGVPVILIVILGLVIHRFLEEPPGRAGIPAGAPTSDTDPGTGVRWGSGTPEAAPAGESASQANRPPGLGDPIPPTVVTDAGRGADPVEAIIAFEELSEELHGGTAGWEAIDRLREISGAFPGSVTGEEARRLTALLEGLRRAVERSGRASAEQALAKVIDEERFGEALVAAGFLSGVDPAEEGRIYWQGRAADIEVLARGRFQELERRLGDLIAQGKAAEALRALVEESPRFAGTPSYARVLPRYVESGLKGVAAAKRVAIPSREIAELEERAMTAFLECRFGDLLPIHTRLLSLELTAEKRMEVLEGLVEGFYLERMFEGFLEGIAGKSVEVSLSEGYRGRVVRADSREVEHEIDLGDGHYRDTEAWGKISTVKKIALFSAVPLPTDGQIGLVYFALRSGYEEGANEALVRLHGRKETRELSEAILARHRGMTIPEGGFVKYRGRLVTSAEREADIARRKEEREAEKSAIAELRRLKRSRKITDYVAWAERLREGGSFELAQRILREIVDKASDEETAEARRLLEDPLLAVTTLADSGPSSNRVDFFFLGEGYQVKDDQQEAFLNSARACMKLFLNSEPYKEYQSYLSFHAAQLGSRDMGVDLYERGVERDTALDGRVEWQAFTVNNGKVMEILDRHGEAGADHLAIVIGNDYADVATGGGGVSCLSKAALSAVSHEVGHSLGGLRDEYDNPAGTNPNRKIVKKRRKDVPTKPRPPNLMEGSDRDDVLAHVIWRNWIDAGTEKWWNGSKVSIFEGGGYSPFNVWRPQASCMMRTSGSRFCVVCMEVMVKRIYRRVRPIDRVEPDEERLSLEEGGQLLIKVWPMKPETHYLDATWTLLDLGSQLPKEPTGRTAVAKKKQEGSLYKRVFRTMDAEGRVLECAQLRAKDLHLGFYRLRLRLHDPTPWVLRDDGGLLTQTRDWLIEIR